MSGIFLDSARSIQEYADSAGQFDAIPVQLAAVFPFNR